MRRLCVPIVAVEKQEILHIPIVCLRSLRYPACNAHVPIVICGPPCCTIIVHIISQTSRLKKKPLLNRKYVVWFSFKTSAETFLFVSRNERDVIKKYSGIQVKYPLFLSYFNETWIFSTVFRKILKYKISWKSFQWEPGCSMRTDGRTDMTKLMSIFCCNFAKTLKRWKQF